MPSPLQAPEALSLRVVGAGMAAAAALTASLSGCSGSASADTRIVVTVSAAASLGTAFESIATDFERNHPDVEISLNVGGSSELAAQIVEGAPADVFAAASPATMATVVAAGVTSSKPKIFARNFLAIAVAPGNAHSIRGLADLAGDDLTVVACAPAVPCGATASAAARAADVSLALASEELSVTDVLAKVASGEADAGLVYRTDVAAAEHVVDSVAVPESVASVTDYPIVALATGQDDAVGRAAAEWIDFVAGPTGSRTLARLGFGAP